MTRGIADATYNEHDAFAASWLENLIDAGHIATGTVDRRSIRDLAPDDVRGKPFHAFAGIGGWSLALRLAGIADDVPIWTGSCPCQPFSSAGRRAGFADARHLWPVWFDLIRECSPPIILGEQVASGAALEWLDAVFADLERAGYACAAADLCSAGVGAPHIRQRLYWCAIRVADSDAGGRSERGARRLHDHGAPGHDADGCGEAGGGMADDASSGRSEGRGTNGARRQDGTGSTDDRGMGNAENGRRPRRWLQPHGRQALESSRPGACESWSDVTWLECHEPTRTVLRPIAPGIEPLAYGLPRGMGRMQPVLRGMAEMAGLDRKSLRRAKRNRSGQIAGYGNAIVPELAAEFIRAVMGTR